MTATRSVLIGALVLAACTAAAPASATPTCVAPARLIQFPSAAPVWEFCMLTPSQSSGADGSGIEIRDAYYNGHKVFKRAHMPVLNVNYVTGCGCFRDWTDSEIKFQVVTQASSPNPLNCPTAECTSGPGNYVEAIVPVVTVCSNGGSHGDVPPGGQSGFKGVAGERLADRMILTSQVSAGWYRYMMSWTFFTDGRIEPRFGFGAVNASCISNSHRHHNYWRLDFDIDDAGNDVIGAPPDGTHARAVIAQENMRNLPDIVKLPPFAVYDTVSRRGYGVVPGQENIDSPVGSPPNWGGPFWHNVQYPFDVTDAFMLEYHESGGVPLELTDNGGACSLTTTFLNFDNDEMVNDNGDVVLWYRGGGWHQAGALDTCPVVGPTLHPVGDWTP